MNSTNSTIYFTPKVDQNGKLLIIPKAALLAGTRINKQTMLRVVNTTNTMHYLCMKDTAFGPGEVANAETGMAIPPNTEVFVSTGRDQKFIKADAEGLQVLEVVAPGR